MKRRSISKSKPTWLSLVVLIIAVIYGIFAKDDGSTVKKTEAPVATGEIEVHCIDVGQGDAILIQTENHNVLVDAGENDYGNRVTEYLQNEGVDSLSLVIGTHAHSDHIGGVDTVLENIDADTLIMGDYDYDTKTYRDVVEVAGEKGIEYIRLDENMTFTFDDALFEIYLPPEGYGDDINDCSIWLMITHGENKYLMYGDGGYRIEEDMLDAGIDLDADVLKCTHHGSSDGTSDALLNAVSPEYAVISVGYNNEYGHPHYETTKKLNKQKITTYRTDKNGNIVFTDNGTDIAVTTSK